MSLTSDKGCLRDAYCQKLSQEHFVTNIDVQSDEHLSDITPVDSFFILNEKVLEFVTKNCQPHKVTYPTIDGQAFTKCTKLTQF